MSNLKRMFIALPLSLAIMASGIGMASAQVTGAPLLSVQMLSSGLSTNVVPGSTNAILAAVQLNTAGSGDDVRISSIPLILTTGNGAFASSLTSCHIANANNISFPLDTNGNVPASLVSGLNNFNLDTPLVLTRNTVTTLDLICNMSSAASNGGSFTFSINSANVVASGNTLGTPAVVTVPNAPIVIPITPVTPGVPNTGAGGDAATNIALISAAIVVAFAGYVYSRRYARR
jgi:hypothetical protein